MSSFTARLELDTRAADFDVLVDQLADYHAAAAHTLQGRVEVTITVPAEGLRQAITTALAVTTGATGFDVFGVEVVPTDEFDRRLGLEPVPDLLSVTETAAELGLTPQRIRQLLDAGQLEGVKIGATWAVPAAAVLRVKTAMIPAGTAPSYRFDG